MIAIAWIARAAFRIAPALLLLCCPAVHAATVESGPSEIQEFYDYSGDLRLILKANPPGCAQGFWFQGRETIAKPGQVDLIKSAIHGRLKVKVVGDDEQRWPQTQEDTCHLQSIALISSQ